MTRLKEIDQEIPILTQKQKTDQRHPNLSMRPYVDSLIFKPVKENQLVNGAPPSMIYAK